MSGRDEVLAGVRGALGERRRADVAVPRGYLTRLTGPDAASRADVVALFTERVAALGVAVRHVGGDELATAVAAVLWGWEAKRIVVPADLPYGWLADLDGVRALADSTVLDVPALAAVDGVVTGCAAAVAQTGTVVLDGGRAQGRRALTLVPDRHLCVVHADQIVGSVPEAVRRLDPDVPQAWISGPPVATPGDGPPHGPRTLEMLVVED
ncbi:LutC/YkgG family protein [Actinomadura rupiterrae]|uniref:LutC/YkgG family protein n=1 Tax=Actinomadura rupiterrae TaxID=559627 RepID=UPI0020A540EB|nr:LUD domain-containing protein [Actinomadura rupiterrae]MCP2341805.1 L-lactate dehydrogenase complex protein LldG [Actinomadura rupiterrae]MCP2343589.1 L-lactate dehydrogenase complex protein LldG [Actinomadura rupiterrae]